MKKRIRLISLLAVTLLSLTGCSMSQPSYYEDSQTGTITVGDAVIISKPDERLHLQTQQNNISANGLYYVPWAIGEGEDFVNSEGKNSKLYDAELYFLLGKTRSPEKAQEGVDSWLSSADDNYKILSQETLTINGHDYTVLSYHFSDENSPYNGGVSAFGTVGPNAICAEFIHQKEYEEEAKSILTGFLEKCEYIE